MNLNENIIIELLHKCYSSKLQCQTKTLYTGMILKADDKGKVIMDYNYFRETLPLKDFGFFKECLATLYKYKWLIKDQNNDTFINLSLIKES